MYLKEIEFQNYGALKNMKYTFQFNPDGTPKPTLFIGKNGSGKTLLLSNIIHSLIEMKRRFYRDIPEVSNQNYYRLGSEHYISSGESYAYTKINFDNNATYTDLMIMDYKKFKENFDPNILPNIPIDKLKSNYYIDLKLPLDNVFQKEIFSFFPVERYYIPTWENKNNDKLRFVFNDSVYVGYNDNSMIKNNLLQDIESWILDVLIDQYMRENNGNNVDKPIFSGKNTNILDMLNYILSKIFKNEYKSVRFGVTPKNKGKRQIQILGMLDNNKEVMV